MLNKKKENTLDMQTADQMLQNIFDVCNTEHNSVPLEVLESYSNYRKDRFSLRKVVLIIIMVAFLALPLFFIPPSISIADKTTDLAKPVYELEVHSILPITSVKAQVEGTNVPVYEGNSSGIYTVEPTVSGEMTISAQCLNYQIDTIKVPVECVDVVAPVTTKHKSEGGYVYIYLEDEMSGVNYKGIYALDPESHKIQPEITNPDESYVAFKSPDTTINLYIPDNAGNILQVILTNK